jgi:hypothetical protein
MICPFGNSLNLWAKHVKRLTGLGTGSNIVSFLMGLMSRITLAMMEWF